LTKIKELIIPKMNGFEATYADWLNASDYVWDAPVGN